MVRSNRCSKYRFLLAPAGILFICNLYLTFHTSKTTPNLSAIVSFLDNVRRTSSETYETIIPKSGIEQQQTTTNSSPETALTTVQDNYYSSGTSNMYTAFSRKKKMLFRYWGQFQGKSSSTEGPIILTTLLSYFSGGTVLVPTPSSSPTVSVSNNKVIELSDVNYFSYTGKNITVLVPSSVTAIYIYMWGGGGSSGY
eukprot:gene35134-45480_t